jgi:hypothetical protein
MIKTFKQCTIALILLTTTSQILPVLTPGNTNNPPSYWQIVINLFWRNPQQPQENQDQAPAGVTENAYIAQLRSDVNGQSCIIPWDEMNEIEKTIRKELRNIDLCDTDKANQIIRSALCNQVPTGTKRDMITLAHEEGCYYTQKEYETIPTSYENNIIARLGRMPHLNGEAIAEYYGEARKNSLRSISRNRTTYR